MRFKSLTPHIHGFCMSLLVSRKSEHAVLPVRGTAGAAGYDLASAEKVLIEPQGKAIVSTGLAIAIPPGHYGRVAPRSGLAAKHSIDVGAGVIGKRPKPLEKNWTEI